jgi:hypothetical protein
VILASRSRPYGAHLAQARRHAQAAQDAEDEAIQKGNRATGRQDEPDGSCQRNPSATLSALAWAGSKQQSTREAYFKMAKAMASVDRVDSRRRRVPWLAVGVISDEPICPSISCGG